MPNHREKIICICEKVGGQIHPLDHTSGHRFTEVVNIDGLIKWVRQNASQKWM